MIAGSVVAIIFALDFMRGLPWVLLSCVTLAFACAAPLFLYLRERRLAELQREGQPDLATP